MSLTQQKLSHTHLGGKPLFLFALLTALCLGYHQASALNSGSVSITNKSGIRFIIDSGSPCGTGPRAAYVAYQVCNTTGGTLTNLTATLSGLPTGFALVAGQPAAQAIGTLTPGSCSTLFWYVSYPCTHLATANMVVTVSDANPGTVASTFEVKTRLTSSTGSSGEVTGITIGASLLPGSTTYVDVKYEIQGNFRTGGLAYFQPAGNTDFDANCLKLTRTEVISSGIPAIVPIGSTNTLSFTAVNALNTNKVAITIRYYFLVNCNAINTKLLPYAANHSGTTTDSNFKYHNNYGDKTIKAPADFPAINPCLLGSPDDFATLQTNTGIATTGDNWSASWGDFNNDGYPDLFLTTHEQKQPNELYRNNQNGTFTKVNAAPFNTDAATSSSSSWGDYDNDGDLDLYVANNIGFTNFLYRNEGGGNFTKILNDPIVSSTSYSHGVSWGDYDNDGFLDMFVAVYWETAFNLLYHNNGDGTFSEVTNHPITNEASRSVTGAWADYNNDGLLDLFVANTGGQNNSLYKNLGGGDFERITTGSIVNDGGSSVGASWGDYDNDGDLDLHVTNAGNEACFLYKNNGDGTFARIMTGDIVTDKGDAHGSAWADWDSDGDLDMFVSRDGRNNSLYRNDGNDVFTKIQNDITDDGGLSFGSAWADYDRDGDLDLFVANRMGTGNFLYKNTRGTCNNWTNIKLTGMVSNKSAIGAKVYLTATIGGKTVTQMRQVTAQSGGGTGSQNDMTVNFGLGNAATISNITVHWPSGYRQTISNQPINQYLSIQEDNVSVVSGMIYYKENIVCGSSLPTPPAASQAATFRTAQAGSWSSSSTWVGGNVPPTSYIFNRTISIEHDVTLTNGSIYMTGNSTIWITNGKLKLSNGNFTWDNGTVKLLNGSIDMTNGNFDLTGFTARLEAVQSKVKVTGHHYSIGKKRWKDSSLQLSGSYNNAGPDTLQNVLMSIGGNYQNYQFASTVVDGAKMHVLSGSFQNLLPAAIKGSGLIIWMDNGNIFNSATWNATISQYCLPGWGSVFGVSSYLPASMDCATIADKFLQDPSDIAQVVNTSGRVGIPYAKVLFQPGNISVYADENGNYSAYLPAGSYTGQQVVGSNFNPICPNVAGTQTVTVSGPGQSYLNKDFGSSVVANLPDLFTEVITTAHRIGENNLLIINYKNIGTATAKDVQVELSLPAEIELLVSSLPYAAAKGTAANLVFSLGDVPANEKGTIFISYTVGLLTPIGTELSVQASILSTDPEISNTNNASVDKSQAVASYDPNDIAVSPARFVKKGEWLQYKIRFQNVGNSPASQVRVEDELPEGLDLSTLELGGVSHTYKLQVEGRKLVWLFPNINLADSLSNEKESHGYITFRIKTQDGLAIGDRMLNRAAIYFDNLQPVITNTVENILIDEVTKESNAVAKPLQLFPNPTSGKVTVQSFDMSQEPDAFFVEIKVFDQFGRQVYESNDVATQRQVLYLYQLGSGTYHVKAVDSKGRAYFGKVVLMKD